MMVVGRVRRGPPEPFRLNNVQFPPGPGGRAENRPTVSDNARGLCRYDFQAVISAEAT
jgi:hypothetical protein